MKKTNKRINYYAEKSDFEEINQALKNSPNKRMYILYMVILNYLHGVSYCQRGILEVLYRNNLSFTRPTYSLKKSDKSKQKEFKELFEILKKI